LGFPEGSRASYCYCVWAVIVHFHVKILRSPYNTFKISLYKTNLKHVLTKIISRHYYIPCQVILNFYCLYT
jgi:hypothetical protein